MSKKQRVKTTRTFRLFSVLVGLMSCTVVYGNMPERYTLADRAIAVVNNTTVVTESDLRVHAALSELDPSFVPVLHHRPDRIEQDVVDVAVLRAIARRVPVYQPKPHQIRARVSRFRSVWRTNKELTDFLTLHGLEGERLPAALRRRMVIERVVHRNFGPPGQNLDEWSQQFEEWLAKERNAARVRIIAPQDDP